MIHSNGMHKIFRSYEPVNLAFRAVASMTSSVSSAFGHGANEFRVTENGKKRKIKIHFSIGMAHVFFEVLGIQLIECFKSCKYMFEWKDTQNVIISLINRIFEFVDCFVNSCELFHMRQPCNKKKKNPPFSNRAPNTVRCATGPFQ